MTDYNNGEWHTWGGEDTKPAKVHAESLIEFIWHDPETDNVGRMKRIAGHDHRDTAPAWDHVLKFRVVKVHREPREFWVFTNGHGDLCVSGTFRRGTIHVREVME